MKYRALNVRKTVLLSCRKAGLFLWENYQMRKVMVMDETAVNRSLVRITHEIIEKTDCTDSLCVLGIKSRGVVLAEILAENLKKFADIDVPFGIIDATMHRDDFTAEQKKERATESVIPFDVTGKTVIIVDDVLYTGRTARAAIETVFALGRPKAVRLAVLIDRGHREIPIRPDFVGKNIPTSRKEKVSVVMQGEDTRGVFLTETAD